MSSNIRIDVTQYMYYTPERAIEWTRYFQGHETCPRIGWSIHCLPDNSVLPQEMAGVSLISILLLFTFDFINAIAVI